MPRRAQRRGTRGVINRSSARLISVSDIKKQLIPGRFRSNQAMKPTALRAEGCCYGQSPTVSINRENHMTERNGHCLCGAVRFHLSAEPLVTRVCWCRDCQHISANGTMNLLVPTAALDISGQLSEFARTAASGNEIRQRFCPSCGCHLFANSSARPQFTVVRAGTLEDPSSVRPTMNIWSSSAPAWACLDPALERVEQQPAPPQGAKPAA